MSGLSILLLGAGGHAESCIDVIEQDGRYTIVGLLGLAEEVGREVSGYRVLGTEGDLPELVRLYGSALVTVGQILNPEIRIRLFDLLRREGASLPSIVSPLAYVSPRASIGDGTIVMHGAIVNAGASVGHNCIVNTRALLEHGASIADHCHIATGASVNGEAEIGRGAFIGSGSIVRERVRIGERCVIGMGQSIRKDCPDGAVVPASKVTA